jgi:hypothetical protein
MIQPRHQVELRLNLLEIVSGILEKRCLIRNTQDWLRIRDNRASGRPLRGVVKLRMTPS